MGADFGIAAAFTSSLSLAVMISLDRVMMGDVYRNRPDHAWFVSSVLGAGFGAVATLCLIALSGMSGSGLSAAAGGAAPIDWTDRALMAVAGALSAQVLRHYFNLFIPKSGDHPNETSIALWFASTPVFIFFVLLAIRQAALLGDLTIGGLALANTSLSFGLLVVASVAALACFEIYDVRDEERSRDRRRDIFLMIGFEIAYALLVSAVLRREGVTPQQTLTLQLFYWLGFAAGARVLASRAFRRAARSSWRRLSKFAGFILLIEVLGMGVYLFDYFALSAVDPTTVKVVTGSHVAGVFVISLLLSGLGARLRANGVRRLWFLGLRLTTARLPTTRPEPGKIARLLLAQALLLLVVVNS
jgi:hypothetical protein